MRTFRANLNEDLHVQGYAGIGKSHLLGALLECLRPEKTLVLARTGAKLATLRERMGLARDGKAGSTFAAFAKALLQAGRPGADKTPARLPGKQAVSQALDILGWRGHDGQATLNVCLKVLENYCTSSHHSSRPGTCPTSSTP